MNPNAILLTLEVSNAYEHPKQSELLTHELAEMSESLESGTDWTEEEQFLVHAFEGEYHGTDTQEGRDFFSGAIADLSEDFPELVFSLNVYEDTGDPRQILRREYYQDGAMQLALPYVVVPDFNPDGELRVVDPEEVP